MGPAGDLLDDDVYALLARRVAGARTTGAPVLFGVAGGVAAGKSTTAAAVRRRLEALGRTVEQVATDGFLLPNRELERRGLTMRKGFPETYDTEALVAALRGVRSGAVVEVPVYSHLTYDRVPGASRALDTAADVVVVEGVNVLQPTVAETLDVSVFVDADEEDAHAWFDRRFLELCEEAIEDPASFYAPLAAAGREVQLEVADAAWSGINAVNLREHILPTRARATFVLCKAADHSVRELRPGPG